MSKSVLPPFLVPQPLKCGEQVKLTTIASDTGTDNVFVVAHQMTLDAPMHTHDYYECVLVTNGVVLNQIGDQAQYLLPDSLLLMNLNSYHELKVIDPSAVVINLGLRPRLFQAGIFHDFFQEANPVSELLRGVDEHAYLYYPFPKSVRIGALIDELLAHYAAHQFHEDYAIDALVLLILDELRQETRFSYSGVDRQSYMILRYIQEHSQTVTLQSLAAEFNFNPSYLSRYIKQHYGMTTKQIITDVRLKEACGLLQQGGMPIETVASTTGYRSASHFFRVFKQRFGITPAAYRRSYVAAAIEHD